MFNPNLSIGQVLTEKEVHDIFECQTMLGIRMSKKNNLFVIMSGSAKKKIYDDQWVGDTLYYNGTDINSDTNANQTLVKGKGNNNYQLFQVWSTPAASRPQIFLFVKFESNKCIYKGEVRLKEQPFLKPRHDDPSRSVYIFPLQLMRVNEEQNLQSYNKAALQAYSVELGKLYKKVKGKTSNNQSLVPQKHEAIHSVYARNPEISTYAKRRAKGVCDLCNQKASFKDKNGNPYLESHHVEWLSEGGIDTIDNVVALCPNCHRKMHIVADKKDKDALLQRLSAYQKYKM